MKAISTHITAQAFLGALKENRRQEFHLVLAKRLIIITAGNQNGELPGCRVTFWADQSTGDYHGNVNNTLYAKWFKEKLLPPLPRRSALILDNASYHKRRIETFEFPPGRTISTFKKEHLLQYLSHYKITPPENALRDTLKDIALKHHESLPIEIVEIVKEKEIVVLFQPPYHPEVQATEEIWGMSKNAVAYNRTNDW